MSVVGLLEAATVTGEKPGVLSKIVGVLGSVSLVLAICVLIVLCVYICYYFAVKRRFTEEPGDVADAKKSFVKVLILLIVGFLFFGGLGIGIKVLKKPAKDPGENAGISGEPIATVTVNDSKESVAASVEESSTVKESEAASESAAESKESEEAGGSEEASGEQAGSNSLQEESGDSAEDDSSEATEEGNASSEAGSAE